MCCIHKEHISVHGCQSAIECSQKLILPIRGISKFDVIIQVAVETVHNAEFSLSKSSYTQRHTHEEPTPLYTLQIHFNDKYKIVLWIALMGLKL